MAGPGIRSDSGWREAFVRINQETTNLKRPHKSEPLEGMKFVETLSTQWLEPIAMNGMCNACNSVLGYRPQPFKPSIRISKLDNFHLHQNTERFVSHRLFFLLMAPNKKLL
jgi:hypothetical protein